MGSAGSLVHSYAKKKELCTQLFLGPSLFFECNFQEYMKSPATDSSVITFQAYHPSTHGFLLQVMPGNLLCQSFGSTIKARSCTGDLLLRSVPAVLALHLSILIEY